MDTNQAQLQQAIANVPANNGPLDPRTGDRIGKPVAPPALRTLPEQPKLPDTTFDGNEVDPIRRMVSWKSFVRALYQRTTAYARRIGDVLAANIEATPFPLLQGWQEFVDDGDTINNSKNFLLASVRHVFSVFLKNTARFLLHPPHVLVTFLKTQRAFTPARHMFLQLSY